MTTSVVIPGQVLGTTSTHNAGPGTHVYENNIIASITGPLTTSPAISKTSKPRLSIPRQTSQFYVPSTPSSNRLPVVGSTVLCRVTRVQQRQLNASILVALDPASAATTTSSNTQYAESDSEKMLISYTSTTNDEQQFSAILRREDIRAYEKDKINMNESYRAGDIIRASVISLGDERNYYVSTAGNEFGVMVAKSEAGNPMVPVSWREMKDIVTGKGEGRKVAKPS